jgi:hypothetical protein
MLYNAQPVSRESILKLDSQAKEIVMNTSLTVGVLVAFLSLQPRRWRLFVRAVRRDGRISVSARGPAKLICGQGWLISS